VKIAVLTSLYPSRTRPHEGVFAERRWTGMLRRGHAVSVTQPLPRAPFAFLGPLLGRPHWLEIARMDAAEVRQGIAIERPRYRHLPGRSLRNARAFARVGALVLRRGDPPDVVVLDYAWPAALAVPLLHGAGIPTVVSGRGSDVLEVAEHEALARELAACLRLAGRWCGVSRDLVAAMDRLAGQPGRGVLVPNGVDLEAFRPSDRSAARRALGRADGGALVLVVGHLIPRKDPLLALAAFAHGAPSDAALVFVGTGPLRGDLERRAAELGLAQRVAVVGAAEPGALRDWYAACDALLLASSREGRPNVVIEALACGRPVVATAAGGTPELLVGLDGALVRSRTPAALGDALGAVLAHPPPPERCRAQVEALTWDASLDALEALLESARAEGARA
jgi:teichuronic acid biosynthesis glycosyltransferase TuaC